MINTLDFDAITVKHDQVAIDFVAEDAYGDNVRHRVRGSDLCELVGVVLVCVDFLE